MNHLSGESSKRGPEAKGLAPSVSGGREILVIDDQPEVRAVVRGMLERTGWGVRSAASRAEALALLVERESAVVLALVDVMMPDCDGLSLARELRQLRPHLSIVLLSGHLNEESRWIVHEMGHPFLAKPFTMSELRDMVARMVGEPGGTSKG